MISRDNEHALLPAGRAPTSETHCCPKFSES
jgi:hypothetical protein